MIAMQLPRPLLLGLALFALTISLAACAPSQVPAAATPLESPLALPAELSEEAATLPPEESSAATIEETLAPEDSADVTTEETPAPEESIPLPTSLPAGTRIIHMLGRSVTYNWFQHWGWEGDDETPVVHGHYLLFHHSIDDPENMVNSVRDIVSTLPDGPSIVVQWKFCFDDFGGAEDAQPTIQRNEGIVHQVYELVVAQHSHKLIIGNALPKVELNVDPELIAAQRQYNLWLADFQAMHREQVFVWDQYSVLADANGALRANLASAPDDSHPNDAGYRALDAKYFNFVDAVLR